MSCSIKSALPQGLRKAVSVNGEVIAHEVISRETQNHPAANPAVAWAAATRALVIRELLLQEAKRCGLQPRPLADDAGRRETDAEALVRGVIEAHVVTPAPDEDSCRRYYESNVGRFRSTDILECAHILIACRRDQAESYTAARGRAEAILARLREQPGEFAALATAHSDCPSRATGGNLGQVTRGMTTPEFERALFSLTPGEISPLVDTPYGVHVIRLDRHIPGRQVPFELVRANIESYLAERSQRLAVAQYIALLADRAQLLGVDLPAPSSLNVH